MKIDFVDLCDTCGKVTRYPCAFHEKKKCHNCHTKPAKTKWWLMLRDSLSGYLSLGFCTKKCLLQSFDLPGRRSTRAMKK